MDDAFKPPKSPEFLKRKRLEKLLIFIPAILRKKKKKKKKEERRAKILQWHYFVKFNLR